MRTVLKGQSWGYGSSPPGALTPVQLFHGSRVFAAALLAGQLAEDGEVADIYAVRAAAAKAGQVPQRVRCTTRQDQGVSLLIQP